MVISPRPAFAFKEVYREALNYGFLALGKQIANVVNDYLTRKYNVKPVDTYENSRLLSEALEKTLGYGSVLVETRVIKSLYAQLSIPLDVQPRIRMGHPEDFERYVQEIRSVVSH